MLDIVGNIGWLSLLAAAHGVEVFTFEPSIVNMVQFCESQVINQWAVPSNQGTDQIQSFLKGVRN